MPHADYLELCYPISCADCIDHNGSCYLDESMPCSPDCPELNIETGEPSFNQDCKHCGAITRDEHIVSVKAEFPVLIHSEEWMPQEAVRKASLSYLKYLLEYYPESIQVSFQKTNYKNN